MVASYKALSKGFIRDSAGEGMMIEFLLEDESANQGSSETINNSRKIGN